MFQCNWLDWLLGVRSMRCIQASAEADWPRRLNRLWLSSHYSNYNIITAAADCGVALLMTTRSLGFDVARLREVVTLWLWSAPAPPQRPESRLLRFVWMWSRAGVVTKRGNKKMLWNWKSRTLYNHAVDSDTSFSWIFSMACRYY